MKTSISILIIILIRCCLLYIGETGTVFERNPDEIRYELESDKFNNIEAKSIFSVSDEFGNEHWLYYYINYLIIPIGGVLLLKVFNCIITLFCGVLLIKFIEKNTNLKISFPVAILIWGLLPDLLTWSTLYNLKDSVVFSLYCLLTTLWFKFDTKINFKNFWLLLLYVCVCFLIYSSRAYLLLVHFVAGSCFLFVKKFNLRFFGCLLFIMLINLAVVYPILILLSGDFISDDILVYTLSTVRFFLTPFGVFGLLDGYYNLIGPYYILGFLLVFVVNVKRKNNPEVKNVIGYIVSNIVSLILFYGFLPQNNGPRQKFLISIFLYLTILIHLYYPRQKNPSLS